MAVLLGTILLIVPNLPRAQAIAAATYSEALAFFETRSMLGEDNRAATMVWGRTFYLESLLQGYLASRDERFLERFIAHADDIFRLRDDMLGRVDYSGRSRPGWSVAQHYTYSEPVVLVDDVGSPSLSVTATRWTGNHATVVDVSRSGDLINIRATNGFRLKEPLVQEFQDLTLAKLEESVNGTRGRNRLVTVKRLGSRPPKPTSGLRFSPLPMVFHTHHTGAILAPILNFARLVGSGQLSHRYRAVAQRYIELAWESVRDYEHNWVEEGDWGYFRIDQGSPFWVDGAPEPINAMSEQGRMHLYLWQATGDRRALEKVKKILRLVARHTEVLEDGALRWPYWHGSALRGWTERDRVSFNTPVFEPYDAYDSTHYAQYTMRFLMEAHALALDISPATPAALRATFNRVWKHDELWRFTDRFLAPGMDGRGWAVGRDDVDVFGFLHIARHYADVGRKVLKIYETKFPPDKTTPVSLYGWALLARLEKESIEPSAR